MHQAVKLKEQKRTRSKGEKNIPDTIKKKSKLWATALRPTTLWENHSFPSKTACKINQMHKWAQALDQDKFGRKEYNW